MNSRTRAQPQKTTAFSGIKVAHTCQAVRELEFPQTRRNPPRCAGARIESPQKGVKSGGSCQHKAGSDTMRGLNLFSGLRVAEIRFEWPL